MSGNQATGDTLRFGVGMWPRPVEFAHRSGRLVIDGDSVMVDLSVVEVHKTPEQSDRLQLRRSIADRDGVVHVLDTFVGAEEIWHMLPGQVGYDDAAYERSWHWPREADEAEEVVLVEKATISIDGRDGWVFQWVDDTGPDALPPTVMLVREKYFGAELDLWATVRKGGATELHAVVRAYGPIQSLAGDDEIADRVPIWFPVSYSTLLWKPGLRRVDRGESGGVWWDPFVREPLLFEETDERAEPNEGVSVV